MHVSVVFIVAITILTSTKVLREAHLNELVQGGVGGIVGNEEPHVFVCDLHRGWSIHTSHGDNVKTKTKQNPKVFLGLNM